MSSLNLAARMSLNTRGFTQPLAGAQQGLAGFTRGLGRVAAPLAGLVAGFLGVRAATRGLKEAFNLGSDLHHMASNTGIAADQLLILRQAFDDAGVGAQNTSRVISRMQQSLSGLGGGGRGAKVVDSLGLDLGELRQQDPTKQLKTIGAAIMELRTPAERSAAAMAIFGRRGAEMLSLFENEGTLDAAAERLGGQAELMLKNSGLFEAITTELGNVGSTIRSLWIGLADQVGPVLLPLLERFNKMDLTRLGQQAGAVIRTLAEGFGDGRLAEGLGLSLKLAFMNSANVLFRALTGAAAGLKTALDALTGPIIDVLGSAQFWKGIGNLALGAFQGLGSGLLRIFATPLAYLEAGIEGLIERLFNLASNLPGLEHLQVDRTSFDDRLESARGSFLARAADSGAEDSRASMERGLSDIREATEPFRKEIVDQTKQIFEAMVDTFHGTDDVFDTSEFKQRMKSFLDEIVEETQSSFQRAPKEESDRGIREIHSDRLSRIGAFVGGAGGPALGHARRTAQNTERTAKELQGIREILNVRDDSATTPVWG